MTMKPQEQFHDHPVIDEQDDGTYLYFQDLPPLLLKGPIITPDDAPPPDENQTTSSNNSDN